MDSCLEKSSRVVSDGGKLERRDRDQKAIPFDSVGK